MLLPTIKNNIWLSNLLALSVPDGGYSRNVSDGGYSRNVPDGGYSRNVSLLLNIIFRFYCYHWVDTFAGGIIRPGVSASPLTWFIRYIYYWMLQFLRNVIIIKPNIVLPQAWVTLADFYYSVYSVGYYCSQTPFFNCLASQSLDWVYVMKVIPETCRTQ